MTADLSAPRAVSRLTRPGVMVSAMTTSDFRWVVQVGGSSGEARDGHVAAGQIAGCRCLRAGKGCRRRPVTDGQAQPLVGAFATGVAQHVAGEGAVSGADRAHDTDGRGNSGPCPV